MRFKDSARIIGIWEYSPALPRTTRISNKLYQHQRDIDTSKQATQPKYSIYMGVEICVELSRTVVEIRLSASYLLLTR